MGIRPDFHRSCLSVRPVGRRAYEPRDRVELYCVPQDAVQSLYHGKYLDSGLKKPLAIRIDADLLAATRDCARRDNRSLTNFIETALRRRVEEMTEVDRAPDGAPSKGTKA